MNPLTTGFVRRLRDRDESAWFELWDVFGPVIRHQLHRWGRGAVGMETVRDLTQETLAALSNSIDRFDPSRGVRFSTWLLSIALYQYFPASFFSRLTYPSNWSSTQVALGLN